VSHARPLVDALAARAAASPFLGTLGCTVDTAEHDRVRLRLAVRPGDVNRNGTLHGGVMASLLATASAFAAGGGDDVPFVAVDQSIVYLAVGRADTVVADGRVLRRGRAIVHAEATVADAEGTALARGFTVLRPGTLPPPGETTPLAGTPPSEPLHEASTSLSPFSARLGVRVALRQAARGVAVLHDGEAVREADGAIAGGALATLLDAASGASAWSVVGFDPRGRAATLAMHLALHAAARDEDVVADSVALPAGDGCHVCVVKLWGRRTRSLVASGSATYRITVGA